MGTKHFSQIIPDSKKSSKLSRFLACAGLWFAFALVAVMFQWAAGAYDCDFGGHPDEGAHFVTGLMLHDYLVSGFPQHPMRYAENYYAHYPKVALGHYPPGFYVLEGVWLTIFPVNRASVLIFMATLCGTFGFLIFNVALRRLGSMALAGVLAWTAIALPLTQTLTFTVMADLALAIAVLLAALAFVRFMESGRWFDSLAFGLWASAATMTKGSGLFLALVPPLAIVLSSRYRLLKNKSLWIAVVPVVLICGPWLYFSRGITAEGMIDRTPLEHLKFALPYFAKQFVNVFGAMLIPAALGIFWALRRKRSAEGRWLSLEPFWAVMLALPICLVVFFSGIPAGLEPRYLLPVVPAVLFLFGGGLIWLRSLFPREQEGTLGWELGVVAVLIFFVGKFRIEVKDFAGFRESVRQLVGEAGARRDALHFLISSDARGEGAFISEVAMLDRNRPSHTVDRSSKVLASSDWLGRGYKPAFASDVELSQFIDEAGYDGVFVDEGIPSIFLVPHHEQISRVMRSREDFERQPGVSPESGSVRRHSSYLRKTPPPASR